MDVVGLQGSVYSVYHRGCRANFEKWVENMYQEVDLLVTVYYIIYVNLGLFVGTNLPSSRKSDSISITTTVLYLPFWSWWTNVGGTHQLIVVSVVHHIFNLFKKLTYYQQLSKTHSTRLLLRLKLAQRAAAVAIGVKTKGKN